MRIWVTGLGVVSPLAAGASETMRRLWGGECAISSVTLFDVTQQRSQIAAEVRGLRGRDIAPRGSHETWSRADAMAAAAADEALRHARVSPKQAAMDLVVGGTTGGTFETEEQLVGLLELPNPGVVTHALTHPLPLVTDRVAAALGPFRRVRTVSSACSTGTQALLLAAAWLRTGRSERVLAGAVDALCRLTFTGFNALGSLSLQPCRPFDGSRSGLSLGEGAAFLVLERDDVARARGVEPLAELVGWAAAAEAHHITNPEANGRTAAHVMRQALRVAGLGADDLDYVNAHGTATVLNDRMEIQALREVAGSEIDRIAVSSTKGQIGHALGAAGALEAVFTVLAIAHQKVPPTGGLTSVGDDCQANHVTGLAWDMPVRAALSNSFGFGGLDASIAFAKPHYAPDLEPSHRRPIYVRSSAVVAPSGLHVRQEPTMAELHAGPIAFDPDPHLDLARARRLGRAERLLAVVVGAALDGVGDAPESMGLVVGKPSGRIEGAAAYLQRARDRGPRLASPADFPNLMLSATVGHAAIYHRLRGPALSSTDLGASGGAGLLTALELLDAECADWMVAAAVDEWDPFGNQLPSRAQLSVPCTDGAGCLVLATVKGPEAKCVVIRAGLSWHSEPERQRDLQELGQPSAGALVLLTGAGAADTLRGSTWAGVRAQDVDARTGAHEASASAAWAMAYAALSRGEASEALAVVAGEHRGYLFLFGIA